MAVLLLYPLQLAVNTVKAVPRAVCVSVFMFAGARLFLAGSPDCGRATSGAGPHGPERSPHPVPDPEQQSIRKAPPPPQACVMPEEALRTELTRL